MAPRKRKGWNGARQSSPRNTPDAMALNNANGANDANALYSARPSTEGAMSAITSSDGPQTAMTSLVDTEEEMSDAPEAVDEPDDDDENDDDDEIEATSIYPVSQFPRARSAYRLGGHFVPGNPRAAASDTASSTRSLWAMDLDYREIHGRRYCREYFMPNDELEQLRLTLQHQVLLQVFDNELTLVPLQAPTHVLDVGTGTGEWAIRFAEIFPNCEVVGTDISAIAETQSVPINVFFEIEDAEDWDRAPDHYDMVHFRWMQGAFRDWSFIYDSAYYSLKPGGWVEVQDFDTSDGLARVLSTFPPQSPIHALFRDVEIAAERSGRKRGTHHLDPLLLMDSGFVDIRVTEYAVPITVGEKAIGKIWLIACLDALEAICLRLLTEYMDWDPEECKAACEEAARELASMARNPATAKGLMIKLRVVVGRKPLVAPRSALFREEMTPPFEPSPNGAPSSRCGANGFQGPGQAATNGHSH